MEKREIYDKIIEKLKTFSDQKEENYNIIALWIIGTYYHKNFTTYPYLYFNAMKGSGKTRVLNMIKSMSRNGKTFNNMTESSLFRTANKGDTICIDEFESITNRDNSSLRELLNSAYKKGSLVMRMKKFKRKEEEGYEPEEFNLFCPIALANINGMDNTVEDRCITIVLDKTDSKIYSMLIEDFGECPDIQFIKESLELMSSSNEHSEGNEVSVVTGYIYNSDYITLVKEWNNYILYNTYNTLTTPLREKDTSDAQKLGVNKGVVSPEFLPFFQNIIKSGLHSRQLEISLPLLVLSKSIGDDVFQNTLRTLARISKEKIKEDASESRDASFLMFLSTHAIKPSYYMKISDFSDSFKEWQQEEWINPKVVGRIFKRLSLSKDKRRVGHGVEVIVDWDAVEKKARQFRQVIDESTEFKCSKCDLVVKKDDFDDSVMMCRFCSGNRGNIV